MTVDRRWALELFQDMQRSGITDTRSNPTTYALYLALLKALTPAGTVRVPELPWGPGKWRRTSFGGHVWHKWHVYPDKPARLGPILARVDRMGPGRWEPWVYPHGEGPGPGMPKDVAVYPKETTLRAAKAVAEREFAARRAEIERG